MAMNNKEDFRTEVLELLARGKISIDEAVKLLDQPSFEAAEILENSSTNGGDSPLKVEIDVDVDIEKEGASNSDQLLEIEDLLITKNQSSVREPRWLRIYVGDLDTGKTKVKLNIPFGMVKFGLGLAQFFAPEEVSTNLQQIETMIAEADSGLLVDVQDIEDNEHVRIYFE
jgi:hypothetical protein